MRRLRERQIALRRQRGTVAIIVGLSIAVLVGFAGLALDTGRLYVSKSELQNSADACALAASYELTGAPAIPAANFVKAENAGLLVATRNRADFQRNAVAAGDVVVEFGTSLANGSAWLAAASNPPGDAKYVRCRITRGGYLPWFMQIMGLGAQTVAAGATASLANAQTNCGLPLGVCALGPAPTYGLVKGQWVSGRFDSHGQVTGSFNWIDYTPNGGGANEIADLLKGSGQCVMAANAQVGEPGALGNAAGQAWNSRFGLYQGSANVNNAPPDWTGHAYTPLSWPQQSNALPDFLAKRQTHTNYGSTVQAGNTITGLSISNAYNPVTTPAQHQQYGADRRLAVAPILDCSEWASTNHRAQIRAWACVLMLHPIASPSDIVRMEFEGLADDPTSPCATSGVVGGAGSVGPLVPGLVQ